jgi:chromosome segregation ATPase
MSNIIDRLNHELETFGRKAQAALDEGKLQIELLRVKRQQDSAARDLGLMIHRRERGIDTEPKRIESLLTRLDTLEREISRLGREIAATKGETATVNEEPVPATATPANMGRDTTTAGGTASGPIV